eukprot:TRINITY_DN67802_c7_g1_i1.p1 TRINITY_DN67802_c7_g1~~TRINITY_DN67802_c7_g1_i1.p1  ORF type:complete len:470 (+),score=30.47 TRINITY_DN67802_c7_g1_i1:45-1454(+)
MMQPPPGAPYSGPYGGYQSSTTTPPGLVLVPPSPSRPPSPRQTPPPPPLGYYPGAPGPSTSSNIPSYTAYPVSPSYGSPSSSSSPPRVRVMDNGYNRSGGEVANAHPSTSSATAYNNARMSMRLVAPLDIVTATQHYLACQCQWFGSGDPYIGKWINLVPRLKPLIQKDRNYARTLLMRGVPAPLRGVVWQITADSMAGVHQRGEQYAAALDKPVADSTKNVIERDLARTFPDNPLFQGAEDVDDDASEHNNSWASSVGQRALYHVLRCLAVQNPVVGYCQGMAFVVGTMLLHMNEVEAFSLFLKLEGLFHLHQLYGERLELLKQYCHTLDILIEKRFPKLKEHMVTQGITATELFATEWFMTLFTNKQTFTWCCRIWDVFMLDGWKWIFKVCLGLLKMEYHKLMGCRDLAELLTALKTLLNDKDIEDVINAAAKVKLTDKQLYKIFAIVGIRDTQTIHAPQNVSVVPN